MARLFERRLTPVDSPLAILATTTTAFLAAMLVTAFLFLSYGASPFQAYIALFHEPFATLRGFGYSLVRASPLALIALGTIVSWRSGFSYLGFEGCFVIGATATGWLALLTAPGARIGPLPFFLFLPLAILFAFAAGGVWAGLVGLVRARLGGNEVLISLMSNYVAIFILQYLVSGPLRAPGSLPETRLLPRTTWLPFLLPGTRAHASILIALAAAGLVWMLLQKMPLGYELVVTGFNPLAARYAGIDVARRLVLAAFFAGGLGAFVGIIVALLSRLNPLAVIPTALLYGGMSVGADAMQRRVSIPSSITFILQSLAVLLVLACDAVRYYKVNPSAIWRRTPQTVAGQASK